jgi:hypothetical protein
MPGAAGRPYCLSAPRRSCANAVRSGLGRDVRMRRAARCSRRHSALTPFQGCCHMSCLGGHVNLVSTRYTPRTASCTCQTVQLGRRAERDSGDGTARPVDLHIELVVARERRPRGRVAEQEQAAQLLRGLRAVHAAQLKQPGRAALDRRGPPRLQPHLLRAGAQVLLLWQATEAAGSGRGCICIDARASYATKLR